MVHKSDMEFVALALFLVWVVVFSLIAGLTGMFAAVRNGQREQVTGIVIVSEQSSLFGQHTQVTFLTFGGAEVVYNFIGYREFELNQTLTITCIDRPIACWVGPFVSFDIWGEII